MNNPTLLTILSTVFILLGAYNLYTASKRAREMKLAGKQFKWLKQINALVGIEYLLLAWVFMLSNLYSNSSISPSVKSIVLPLYLICLLAAALFAGLVIFRGIFNARAIRAARSQTTTAARNGNSSALNSTALRNENAQAHSDNNERRRERRKNAAAARRRRAGKA